MRCWLPSAVSMISLPRVLLTDGSVPAAWAQPSRARWASSVSRGRAEVSLGSRRAEGRRASLGKKPGHLQTRAACSLTFDLWTLRWMVLMVLSLVMMLSSYWEHSSWTGEQSRSFLEEPDVLSLTSSVDISCLVSCLSRAGVWNVNVCS